MNAPAIASATPAVMPVMASPAPLPTRSAVPMPSLKPGETITWIKLERPRFALGEVVISSFKIVGLAILGALLIGVLLGHLRSRSAGRQGAHGTGGLSLR